MDQENNENEENQSSVLLWAGIALIAAIVTFFFFRRRIFTSIYLPPKINSSGLFLESLPEPVDGPVRPGQTANITISPQKMPIKDNEVIKITPSYTYQIGNNPPPPPTVLAPCTFTKDTPDPKTYQIPTNSNWNQHQLYIHAEGDAVDGNGNKDHKTSDHLVDFHY